jgi:filamentous hemagglutinin family protein
MFTRQLLIKVSLGLGFVITFLSPVRSQITPNGAGTVVNSQGNQVNITGGTQAGANLFHSFRDFNINSSQIANFLSNPQIQNILARINGGNPSFINGLLQVTGGNSNLFLMNPAGIIFGQGASLNVTASFTATTANQIGLGNNQYFSAVGNNNYAALIGNPDSFLFTTNQAGSIINTGNLSVRSGQGISLIGGNIVNTGNLNAGNITLAAVPGTNRVRISQPGHILSLEIIPPVDSVITPLDLPRLLTGSDLPGITSNGETVQVVGVNIPTGQGINIASGNLSTGSQGGVINVLGDRIALINANINASGNNGGGTIRVGGEYRGGGNNPFNSRMTYVDSRSFLRADAINSGNGGRVIVWADDTTRFYGNISGRGITGSGGFVEVSGKVNLAFDGRVELPGANGLNGTLLLDPTDITIQAAAGNGDGSLPNIGIGAAPAAMTISAGALAAIAPTTAVDIQASNNITFNVPVTFAPCIAGICGGISFTAGGIFNTNGNDITAAGRGLNITAGSITARDINTSSSTTLRNGGSVNLRTNNGSISTRDINTESSVIGAATGNGGQIDLNAFNGNISAREISSGAGTNNGNAGLGGDINISARVGNINIVGNVDSRSVSQGIGNSSNAGAITIIAQSVNVGTPSDPLTGAIAAYSRVGTGNSGNGGNIVVTATNGGITAAAITTATRVSGNGISGSAGLIEIDATSDVILRGGIVSAVSPNPISIDSRSESSGSNAGAGGNVRINRINQPSIGNFIAGGAIYSFSSAIDIPGTGSLNGGAIAITAQSIAVDIIDSYAVVASGTSGNGGAINLNARNNITATGLLESSSFSGTGGEINLTATNGNIRLDSLYSGSNLGNSGAINLTAGGNVRTLDLVDSSSLGGNSGAINLTAGSDINTSNLTTSSGGGNSGAINLTAAGNISTSSNVFSGSTAGNGGAINLTAGGNISASDVLDSNSAGNGGAINLTAGNDISTSLLYSGGLGNSGAISLIAPNGNIRVNDSINTESQSATGLGGNVTIVAGNRFLATGSFPARDGITQASISTQGDAGGGAINITHGGSTSVPFLVGNATSNGTTAAITSGTGANNTINVNFTVPVPPEVYNRGTNISIRTTAPATIPAFLIPLLINPAPPPPPSVVLVGTPPPIPEPIPVTSVVLPNNPPLTPPSPAVTNPPNIPIISPVVLTPPSPPPSISVNPPLVNPPLVRPNLEATSPGVQPSLSGSSSNSHIPILERIPTDFLGNSLRLLDQSFKEEFQAFTGVGDEIATLDVSQAQNILNRVSRETNTRPVFIYVFFSPLNELTQTPRTANSSRVGIIRTPQNTDTLEVVLVPPTGDLIRVKYPNLPRSEVIQIAGEFTRGIARKNIVYARASKRMYDLIVSPLEEDLKRLKIDNLVFLMDAGLRSMPIAAMQNKDNRFIIEDYSVALMPSLTLTDTTYISLKDSQVMAMGADRFVVNSLAPLPGVPIELNAINQIRGGNIFLNENFTLNNLRQNRRPEQRIIHLATHGSFSGDKTTSFIQLWGTERLTLDQIRRSGFGTPPVDLLVLSACETALGDRESELGFAGLAVTSGVRSALASLWQVSDEGTMGLMAEFYQQLQTTTTKSEALRQAQLAMLRGEVRLEGGSLVTPKGNFALNEELQKLGDRTLTHPYFWSAFTMIGNPW